MIWGEKGGARQVPLGHFIPKFFLGGLFMGSGASFLESAFLSFRSLPPLWVLGYRLPSLQCPCRVAVGVFVGA